MENSELLEFSSCMSLTSVSTHVHVSHVLARARIRTRSPHLQNDSTLLACSDTRFNILYGQKYGRHVGQCALVAANTVGSLCPHSTQHRSAARAAL